MAAPFGHIAIGMLVARRMGVRSRIGLLAAGLAANLPDIDIPVGYVLHGDPWKLHRKGTHTANFALTTGALAGLVGAISAETVEGERDLIADTLTGAAIVGSHLVLDKLPYVPDINIGPKVIGMPIPNWIIDAIQWGVVAYWLWPKEEAARPSADSA